MTKTTDTILHEKKSQMAKFIAIYLNSDVVYRKANLRDLIMLSVVLIGTIGFAIL